MESSSATSSVSAAVVLAIAEAYEPLALKAAVAPPQLACTSASDSCATMSSTRRRGRPPPRPVPDVEAGAGPAPEAEPPAWAAMPAQARCWAYVAPAPRGA